MSDNRRRRSPGSFGARLRAAVSVLATGTVPAGRFGPLVTASDWNRRLAGDDAGLVDETTALNLSGVWACVSLLADTVSSLPVGVFRREGERRLPEANHPINRLLTGAVNDYQGRRAAFKVVEARRQLSGNGYFQIERDSSGVPVGLWPLTNAAPRRRADGTLIYEVGTGEGRQVIAPTDVLHLKGLSTTSGLIGESPIAAACNALSLNIHAEKFGRDFFRNEARSGGFLMHPGKLTDDAKRKVRQSLKDQVRAVGEAPITEVGNQHHDLRVLEEGMKFVATTIAPEEAQFLSTRQFQLEEMARFYRVPLVLLQSTEKTTSWGTGVESLMIAFSQFTIGPLALSWEDELSLKLLTPKEREEGLYVRMDLRALMRGDSASRAAFYQSGIQNQWLPPNEVRAREELDPLPGGDEPVRKTERPTIE
jgi:HK97 family phage portal protein